GSCSLRELPRLAENLKAGGVCRQQGRRCRFLSVRNPGRGEALMATNPSSKQQRPSNVPLAVWPVAQTSAQYQRAGRYHPDSALHPGKMLPALAARVVAEYSEPGQVVVDPMCGIGTTLVEAALLRRRCIGVELEARWARLAA